MQKLHFIGTCVNCFDEDGDCIIAQLPWSNVSEFACADEQATVIDREAFLNQTIPGDLINEVNKPSACFLSADGIMMIYNPDTDIHYFFA